MEFLRIETREVETETGGIERVQFGGEQLVMPAGQLGQTVVGDAAGTDLRCRQVRQPDDRHLLEPQMLRRLEPAVAGDDLAVVGDHHRCRPAVLDQRGSDPGDLLGEEREHGDRPFLLCCGPA
jgi:hypothetical protein